MTGYNVQRPGTPDGYGLSSKGLLVPSGGGAIAEANPVVDSQVVDVSTGDIDFVVPAGLANDDLVIIFIHKDDEQSGNDWQLESGFTQDAAFNTFSGADHAFMICHKLITDAATEITNSPWTFSHTDNAEWKSGVAVVTRGSHNLTTPLAAVQRQVEAAVGNVTTTEDDQWIYSFNGYSLDSSGAEHVSQASSFAEALGADYYEVGRTIPANQTGQTSAQGEWWQAGAAGAQTGRTVQSASVAGTSGGGYAWAAARP